MPAGAADPAPRRAWGPRRGGPGSPLGQESVSRAGGFPRDRSQLCRCSQTASPHRQRDRPGAPRTSLPVRAPAGPMGLVTNTANPSQHGRDRQALSSPRSASLREVQGDRRPEVRTGRGTRSGGAAVLQVSPTPMARSCTQNTLVTYCTSDILLNFMEPLGQYFLSTK